MSQKPSLPKGTRDFGPETMSKRNFIFENIKKVFQKFGYMPLETPSMENLSVLTGKYGDEGDQLIFKVLNSGDYLKKTSVEDYQNGSKQLMPKIAEKGLRYDLTVPFARYVVMNQHNITFPFKRYQIQPVWRADRPQRGRYREFYQCDADVVGTDSLICEAEIVLMINEVFELLGIQDYSIKINHRQILAAMAQLAGGENETAFYVALDKLDKIGADAVFEELISKGYAASNLEKIKPLLKLEGSNEEKIEFIINTLGHLEAGQNGSNDLQETFKLLQQFDSVNNHVDLDFTLARGLSYYTGAIFEVKVNHVSIGSVSGGGRYDNLTGVFGLDGVSGVGFSFGVDRLYDVMEELGLFKEKAMHSTEVLLYSFDQESMPYGFKVLNALRANGIKSEIYPTQVKLKKALNFADKKKIPFVLLLGPDEIKNNTLCVKDMNSGAQNNQTLEDFLSLMS